MSNPKKPLITRERYREYQKEQTKKSAGASKAGTETNKGKADAVKTSLDATGKEPLTRKKENPGTQGNGASRKSQSAVKKEPNKNHKKNDNKTKDLRLTSKEKGRQLDSFLNKAIFIVLLLIVLVFVIAFIL